MILADLYGNTTDLQSVLTAVNDVKSEVNTQTDLIAQIIEALKGKTSGSGSSSSGAIETGTITFTLADSYWNYPLYIMYTTLVDGVVKSEYVQVKNNCDVEIQGIKGTYVLLYKYDDVSVYDVTNSNIEAPYSFDSYYKVLFFEITQDDGHVAFDFE